MVNRGLVVITFFAALFVGQADGWTADNINLFMISCIN